MKENLAKLLWFFSDIFSFPTLFLSLSPSLSPTLYSSFLLVNASASKAKTFAGQKTDVTMFSVVIDKKH